MLVHCFACDYRLYGVVVAWGDVLLKDDERRRRRQDDGMRTPEEIIASMNNMLPPPYSRMLESTIYTAAVWNSPGAVPDDFVVGNGSVTKGPDGRNYTNARLREGTRYGIFNYIRLVSDNPVS